MDRFVLGDIVELKKSKRKAKVKFIGDVKDKSEIMYGVELQSGKGNNNGRFKGIKYFDITNNEKRGLFVEKNAISKLVKVASNMHRITINDSKYFDKYDCFGFIKFIGNVSGKAGIFYGVELVEAKGKNNGSLKNRQYFKCNDNCGIFIKAKEFQDELNNDDTKDEPDEKFNVVEKIDPNIAITPFLQKKKCFSDGLVAALKNQGIYKGADIKNIRSNMVWNAILREVCKNAKGSEAKKNAHKILKKFERIWRKTSGIKSMNVKRAKRKSFKQKPIKSSATKPTIQSSTKVTTVTTQIVQTAEANNNNDNDNNDNDTANTLNPEPKLQNELNAELQSLENMRETIESEQHKLKQQIEIEQRMKALDAERNKLKDAQITNEVTKMAQQLESLHKLKMEGLTQKYELEANILKQKLANSTQQLSTTTQQLTRQKQKLMAVTNELEIVKQKLLNAGAERKECDKGKLERIVEHIETERIVWDTSKYLEWSSDAVVDFLSTVEHGKYKKYENKLRDVFKKQGVDGSALPHITTIDLQGWGVHNFMDRTFMLKQITNLRAKKSIVPIQNAPIQNAPIQNAPGNDEGTITAYHN